MAGCPCDGPDAALPEPVGPTLLTTPPRRRSIRSTGSVTPFFPRPPKIVIVSTPSSFLLVPSGSSWTEPESASLHVRNRDAFHSYGNQAGSLFEKTEQAPLALDGRRRVEAFAGRGRRGQWLEPAPSRRRRDGSGESTPAERMRFVWSGAWPSPSASAGEVDD